MNKVFSILSGWKVEMLLRWSNEDSSIPKGCWYQLMGINFGTLVGYRLPCNLGNLDKINVVQSLLEHL